MGYEERRVSRRGFLVHSGGATAAAVAVSQGWSLAADAKAADLRFGFTTYQWGQDWDLPTTIANCTKAGVFGVELRTSLGYAHGVELELDAQRRSEVRKRFQASPVTLVGLATSERFDWPEPEKVKAAIEQSKAFAKLSHDLGSSGIRVFPNNYHKDIPAEQTIAQIARAVNEVGAFAADYGQQVRLEAHGPAGDLPSIRAIMDQVTQPNVRVKLNSEKRNAEGPGFEHQFNLVKDLLGSTLHLHELDKPDFPYQLQVNLLRKIGWNGWALMEASAKVPDRVQALIQQRELWDGLMANA
ncbi:MAG TPA: TIM barrel protein [Candidatus Anammoximicrobium sp.]|nr:TIM barrel protein [Candidatus Anammoximicrobium sp.]